MIGAACGLVVNIGGKTLYHLGDTALFSDLKLIAERTPVEIAFIPIGGHYTMDRQDAVVAAEFVGADTVIPVHYNTFPPIETDAEAFKSDVESKTSSKVVVLAPGESPRYSAGASRPGDRAGTRPSGPSSRAPSARRRRASTRSRDWPRAPRQQLRDAGAQRRRCR